VGNLGGWRADRRRS